MVAIYVNLVLQGKRNIEQVPAKWRAEVVKKLQELQELNNNVGNT